jgi:hypothetical protein
VSIVAAASEALGRDGTLLGPRGGLHDLEERETDRLLQLRIALNLYIRAVPDIGQIVALAGH